MGTPLPPNEPAEPCTSCWGIGKTFGDTETPQVLQVRLTRLLQGEFGSSESEQLLLTTHWLERVQAFCTWEIIASGFLWRLVYSLQFTNLIVERISDGKRAFQDTFPPTCQLDLENDLQDGDDRIAFGGFANITWDLEGL